MMLVRFLFLIFTPTVRAVLFLHIDVAYISKKGKEQVLPTKHVLLFFTGKQLRSSDLIQL